MYDALMSMTNIETRKKSERAIFFTQKREKFVFSHEKQRIR
jgi:hypothetical protein